MALFQVNHHFRHDNSFYTDVEHPRWGVIVCVKSNRAIKEGEEILTHYLYEFDEPPNDYPWYFEQKRKFEEEEEKMRRKFLKEANTKTKKKTKRKKST